MSSTYEVLLARPGLVPLYLARQGARGPNAVRLGSIMDALLVRAGVDEDAVPDARRALIVHTLGVAAFATSPQNEVQGDPPVSPPESRRILATSLQWLLTGITANA